MTTFEVKEIAPQAAAAIHAEAPMSELTGVFDRAFPEVMRVAGTQGIPIMGPPFGFYPRAPAATVEVYVGFPVAGPVSAEGEVEPFELPGGQAVTAVHVGPYDALERTYAELLEWTTSQGLTLAQGMWEQYLTDPSAEPDPATWQTLIVWPLA